MALIISARNLQFDSIAEVGDTFACLSGDVTRYTVVGPVRPAQLTRGYDDTVGVVVPVATWDGRPAAILLGGDRAVRVIRSAYHRPVRPTLRPNLSPRLSALTESRPSAAWSPLASVGSSALRCGDDIGRADRAYRANGATTECDGDADWRV